MDPQSPRQSPTCCFCFTTSSSTKEKKKSPMRSISMDHNDMEMEILTDMSTFSVKEQERRLKMALKEEKKISREAEKVVNWVKQESSRIDDSRLKNITSAQSDDDDDQQYLSSKTHK